MNDPIADMLTRIRNGQKARHARVDIPASKLKLKLAEILKSEGYIQDYRLIEDKRSGLLEVKLKYNADNSPVIEHIRRVSSPGRRVYKACDEIPVVRNGLGITILTTSKGLMTGSEATKQRIGGELLALVW